MSRFVIHEKVYDTDKMAQIGTVKKWRKNEFMSMLMHEELGNMISHNLYRSSKGNYLLTWEDYLKIYGEAIEEEEAKCLLMKYDYDNYRKTFGDLEEA